MPSPAVSLFGTASMILYPLLFGLLHLERPHLRSLGRLHRFTKSHRSSPPPSRPIRPQSDIAVPVKLARVAMLAPLVLTLGSLRLRRDERMPMHLDCDGGRSFRSS